MAEQMDRLFAPELRHQLIPMTDIRHQILDAVGRKYECDLDELVQVCPRFTWNQLFLEVDRLSRTGELRLFLNASGVYRVRLP
ncbi:MAG: hypothetical protein L0H94_03655 [Nitrospira sp.]|nr:hypothetical protein [Nitrospira sp.]